jgi:hypothetical protein
MFYKIIEIRNLSLFMGGGRAKAFLKTLLAIIYNWNNFQFVKKSFLKKWQKQPFLKNSQASTWKRDYLSPCSDGDHFRCIVIEVSNLTEQRKVTDNIANMRKLCYGISLRHNGNGQKGNVTSTANVHELEILAQSMMEKWVLTLFWLLYKFIWQFSLTFSMEI